MKLSDYCEVPKSFEDIKLTPEEENALLQEIKRISTMKPISKNQGEFNAKALMELIKAVEKIR